MPKFTQSQIAAAMATACSSPALKIPQRECMIWLFGGCAPDTLLQAIIEGITRANGMPVINENYTYEEGPFVAALSKIVGAEMAMAASEHILAELEGEEE